MFKNGPSDQLLMHQILQGSQEAANTLFYRYYDRIFHFLLLNRVSNREDARDLTQDTFRKAWENLENLRNTERFDAWLYRIAKNLATDYFRRRRPQTSLEELPYEEERNLPDENWVLAYMHFQQVLLEMPEKERKCLQLMVNGLSHEEIANCLKLEIKTVDAYISKGRKKLRISFFGVNSKKSASHALKSPVLQATSFRIVEGNSLNESAL
ncbi:MAG TPA: RNA polymerase sigma factor [Ktedonobacteraceae bacterium]|jgi:RNA polymerase sigma-70 factor (ECF subfamily)